MTKKLPTREEGVRLSAKELMKYELPWFVEYISIGWLQTIIGIHYGNKISRKLDRYSMRKARENFLERITKREAPAPDKG